MSAAADRRLLFGLLALQNGLISRVQLVAAFQAWTLDKVAALADQLETRGDLDADGRAAVEAMVALYIKKHGGHTEKSLASIPAGRSTRESLARLGDPEIDATLGHVGSGHRSTREGEDDRTASYAVGTATRDGQRFRVLRPHARRPGGRLRGARWRAEPRGGPEADPRPSRRRPGQPPAVPHRGRDHRRTGTSGDRPGLRPGHLRRRPPVLRDAVHQGRQPQGGDRAIPRRSRRRSGRAPGRRNTELELRRLLRRFLDVCNAIDYAHSRGVLHRDIKPGNIIVGKHGETLVVDWGLAKPLGRVEPGQEAGERTLVPSSGSGSASTLPGSALGTPAYMSPEQACGDLDRLGPRSDVYSLGATLYKQLLGDRPAAVRKR